MQRHKIIVRIILLTLYAISFALAAPVLERGTREERVGVGVTEDATTASQKRWNPSDKWWMNAALADGTIFPQSLGSSRSDYRLEELRSYDPRSPKGSGTSLQPGLGSTDPDNSRPLPVEPTDGADFNSHSPGSPTGSDSYSTDSMSPWWWYETWAITKSQSSSPSHDSGPPPKHPNLELLNAFDYYRPDLKPVTWSDTVGVWPHPPLDLPRRPLSDLGPPKRERPHSPTNSEKSTGAQPPPDPTTPPDPEQSTDAHPPSGPRPLQQESESVLSELLRGDRVKRRISDSSSRSVNAAPGRVAGYP